MKKLNSKLFGNYKLNKSQLNSIVGGSYTAVGSDSTMTGGNFDISYNTLDSSGEHVEVDHTGTGTSTRDKPGECLTHA
jgi:hypothetical protein